MRTQQSNYLPYRVWPDSTVQLVEDGEAYTWMSDDFAVVFARCEEEADRLVNGRKPHIQRHGSYWCVYRNGAMISSWPTLEAAWLRFKEYHYGR